MTKKTDIQDQIAEIEKVLDFTDRAIARTDQEDECDGVNIHSAMKSVQMNRRLQKIDLTKNIHQIQQIQASLDAAPRTPLNSIEGSPFQLGPLINLHSETRNETGRWRAPITKFDIIAGENITREGEWTDEYGDSLDFEPSDWSPL